jgi:hypothetical protein
MVLPLLCIFQVIISLAFRGGTEQLNQHREKEDMDMYATMRRYEGVTDATEAGWQVKEAFLPVIADIPGFVAYYWVDAGGGVMISLSVFQDKAGAEESNRKATEVVLDTLVSLLPKPPQITVGEVVAHKAK